MFDTLTRMGASQPSGYSIDRSLRFNDPDDAVLTRTAGTSTNQNKFTFSTWVKLARGAEAAINYGELINGYTASNDTGFGAIYFYSGSLRFAGWSTNWRVTSRVFKDPSSWYHIIVAVDTTLGTADNRVKMYINGVEETSFSTSNNPGQNDTFGISNNSAAMRIGMDNSASSSRTFDGYMAETHFIDGQQLTAASFGETDTDTGQWIPKKYAGTYGDNGFYLNFSDNSNTTAGTLGADSSGNGNNFTPNNFSVSAGAGNDSTEDTPTNNFCTLNPLDNGGVTLSNGGLVTTLTEGFKLVRSTFWLDTGKWYWEVVLDDSTESFIGVSPLSEALNNRGAMSDSSSINIRTTSGEKYIGGANTSYGTGASNGDVMMCALDCDNGKFWAGLNGTWFDSGNPATGANAGSTAITKLVSPSISVYDNEDHTMNFGSQMDFAHTPPTGFKSLCTANLPEPTIKNGNDYFKAILYTGNGTTDQAKTVGFQPDLLWIKKRSHSDDNIISDSVITPPDYLKTNTTAAEATYAEGIKSFDANGFTLGSANNINQNTHTFVAWSWKEAASAGFDIVGYEGTGADLNVSHGLGVAPDLVLIKGRETTNDWTMINKDISDGNQINLNLNAAASGHGSMWGSSFTRPTSSVFTVGNAGETGTDDKDYIAYCFSSVEGYSRFGTYTGNALAAADGGRGPYVYTGFKPAFVMVKGIGNTGHWNIFDNARDPANQISRRLMANEPGEEVTNHQNYQFALYSNGFVPETTAADKNQSGITFIYMAFAESPFKYANAR